METQTTLAPFEFKGGLFPLTALQITEASLKQLETALQQKIAQAPNFFRNAPLIIDLQKVKHETVDLPALLDILKQNALYPVGLRGASQAQFTQALQLGLPALPEDKSAAKKTAPVTNTAAKATATQMPITKQQLEILPAQNKLITSPVRSGQQVFAPLGDIIVMNHVSEGAELLAHGNIHVYGSLRGRALAGIHGDAQARIFCKSLEAELISIAGNYLVSEDLSTSLHWGKNVVCALNQDKLSITDL